MSLHHRVALWLPRCGLIAFGFTLFLLSPSFSAGQQPADKPPPHEKQIEELEKQIKELEKKKEELKQAKEQPPAPTAAAFPAEWVKSLKWRAIGPANMGGRIVAISVFEADPTTYWIATSSGGLLKTANNGITYEHQFDKEATVSIGDVCVAQSDRNIVWLGTGEHNPRNSVSYGDGVYKSTDAGKTWTNMGLKKSFQIGRVVVHPKNPDIVYVGALGRLYGPSEERGLYKTTDGGKTWQRILYVDDKTGVIDLQMHPTEPDTLLISLWERQRDGYDVNEPAKRVGPGSGLYKTTDGGKTFKKLSKGLPTCPLGRAGFSYYVKDPKIVYLILESEKLGMGPPRDPSKPQAAPAYLGVQAEDAEAGARVTEVTPDGPAAKAGLQTGDVIQAFGDKTIKSYSDMVDHLRNQNAGDKTKIKIFRGKDAKEIEVTFGTRPAPRDEMAQMMQGDPRRPFGSGIMGQQANAQERQGPDGHEYGGIYKSTDGGESWTRVNSYNPRPMYFSQIRVDPNDSNMIYVCGVPLYRSKDGGKTVRPEGGRNLHADQHALWINPKDSRHMIIGTDGGHYMTYDRGENWDHHNHVAIGQFYHVAVDPRRPYRVYGGLQDNGTWGGPSQVKGGAGMFGGSGVGPVNEDWILVGGGDGFRCCVDPIDPDQVYWTSQNGNMGRRNFRTGETGFIRPRMPQGQRARFNWNTPFILSSHNSRIFYCAGNSVFRCVDRGNNLKSISPEITATSQGSGTALAESPKNPNVLYAGTDDGQLWVTQDGGVKWTNITKNVGLPGPRWVATIEASRFEEGRAYVVFDGHRSDDDNPYVYVTEDFGKTWKSLNANLPKWGSTRCCREDIQNPNVLYVGTEFAVWASIDRGGSWTKINNNLPTVAVHDFAQHPTSGEIVAATHGRSLWVLEVTPIRQMNADVLKAKAHLFKPTTAIRWQPEPGRGRTLRKFVGENPPAGAQIYYLLAKKAEKLDLKVVDHEGKTIREIQAKSEPGLHQASWSLTSTSRQQQPRGTPRSSRGAGGPSVSSPPLPAGTYRVVLTVDGQDYSQGIRVEADPNAPANLMAEGQEAEKIDD